jgi:hypothetical protein
VIVIKVSQVINILEVYDDRDMYKDVCDSLNLLLQEYGDMAYKQDNIISKQGEYIHDFLTQEGLLMGELEDCKNSKDIKRRSNNKIVLCMSGVIVLETLLLIVALL